MTVPDFQTLMNPVLDLYEKKNTELRPRDIEDEIAGLFNLSEEDKNQMIPSNIETVLRNRVSWAVYYLFRAGLLNRPRRGYYKISEIGAQENKIGNKINIGYLKKFPSFVDFSNIDNKKTEDVVENDECQTPDEMISKAQVLYFNNLQNELLEKLKQVDPVKFERIVLQLMEKMNYGIGSMTPKSHDGGIDGIIDEDELGLERIYLQAKRYSDNKVNEKEITYFIGALNRNKVRKGVFMTTSYFSDSAIEAANDARDLMIQLVNGAQLTKLMIKHNVGVQIKDTIQIKKIDEDFFFDGE